VENKKDRFVTELFIANYTALHRFAYILTGNKELAKDLVQQVFSILLVCINDVINHEKPVGWLYITLKNVYKQEMAKPEYAHNMAPYDESTIDPCITQALENKESLWEILPEELSDNEKQILQWYYGERLTYYEIANRLAIKEVACRQRLTRALRHCRELLLKK
jgi:RNA polymerase sigma-70 factor (ECF subfamily)